jgi:hypothetical protein
MSQPPGDSEEPLQILQDAAPAAEDGMSTVVDNEECAADPPDGAASDLAEPASDGKGAKDPTYVNLDSGDEVNDSGSDTDDEDEDAWTEENVWGKCDVIQKWIDQKAYVPLARLTWTRTPKTRGQTRDLLPQRLKELHRKVHDEGFLEEVNCMLLDLDGMCPCAPTCCDARHHRITVHGFTGTSLTLNGVLSVYPIVLCSCTQMGRTSRLGVSTSPRSLTVYGGTTRDHSMREDGERQRRSWHPSTARYWPPPVHAH